MLVRLLQCVWGVFSFMPEPVCFNFSKLERIFGKMVLFLMGESFDDERRRKNFLVLKRLSSFAV